MEHLKQSHANVVALTYVTFKILIMIYFETYINVCTYPRQPSVLSVKSTEGLYLTGQWQSYALASNDVVSALI